MFIMWCVVGAAVRLPFYSGCVSHAAAAPPAATGSALSYGNTTACQLRYIKLHDNNGKPKRIIRQGCAAVGLLQLDVMSRDQSQIRVLTESQYSRKEPKNTSWFHIWPSNSTIDSSVGVLWWWGVLLIALPVR